MHYRDPYVLTYIQIQNDIVTRLFASLFARQLITLFQIMVSCNNLILYIKISIPIPTSCLTWVPPLSLGFPLLTFLWWLMWLSAKVLMSCPTSLSLASFHFSMSTRSCSLAMEIYRSSQSLHLPAGVGVN